MTHFDVFVSYHQADRELARDVVAYLRAHNLSVWFDEDCVPPGVSWIKALCEGIGESGATVILIGAAGLTPWMNQEAERALSAAAERQHSIIPVMLPTAPANLPELPILLHREAVDCRSMNLSPYIGDKLIWGLTGRKPVTVLPQTGREFKLRLPRPEGPPRVLEVYTLPNTTPNLLHLDWHTFGKCVTRLVEQITSMGWHLNADACIGINDAGLVMATFFSSAALDRARLGYLRCRGTGTVDGTHFFAPGCFLPPLRRKPTILVADFELKSGKGLRNVFDRLRNEYEDPAVYFAVCGAMTRTPNLVIKGVDELEASPNLAQTPICGLFFAATMGYPGIEPPLELR